VFAEYYKQYSSEFVSVIQTLDFAMVDRIMEQLEAARVEGRKVFVIGNGGSASSASHWTCDFGKGVNVGDNKRFHMVSIVDHLPWVTALGNDISYDDIFVEPLKNLMEAGDLLIGLSVSGNSENIVRAFQYAKENGAKTISLIGNGAGKLSQLSDMTLVIPSGDYGIVEDVHMFVNHVISQFLKRKYVQEAAGHDVKGVKAVGDSG
jgi:D-sedoheptulose 7-phosphate isomerase